MQSLMSYQLPSMNKDIVKYIEKHGTPATYSRFHRQPQVQNGAIVYMHQTKDRMSFVNEPRFKGKTFYHVTNPYEHVIHNNKEEKSDINAYSKLYFDNTSLNIVSRAFYKIWEILMLFDPVPSTGPLVSAHLAEAPGSFVQSLMYYREKFYTNHSKDEHYTISLEDQDVPAFKKDFRRIYPKVKIYEQDGGDLTTRQSITGFERFSKKADLITADGGFVWTNENYQEQEAFRLILGEIIAALKIQKTGGTFILKIFETYTDVSIKLMSLLSATYDDTFLFKPYTSRPSNSEKYIICRGFKGVSDKFIEALLKLLEDMNAHQESGQKIADLLPDFPIPSDYRNTFVFASTRLTSTQFMAINKMVEFVNSNEYYGSQYQQYLKNQQDANDSWVQMFYPIGNSDYTSVRRILNGFFDTSMAETQNKIDEFIAEIIPI